MSARNTSSRLGWASAVLAEGEPASVTAASAPRDRGRFAPPAGRSAADPAPVLERIPPRSPLRVDEPAAVASALALLPDAGSPSASTRWPSQQPSTRCSWRSPAKPADGTAPRPRGGLDVTIDQTTDARRISTPG
ncbi:hypothetical protein [Nonomuraea rubra]|uniref:hypothetical protein n=1 Tax=Nonomuraea rubra TaxID=46180 RepID=UPI0031ECD357